MLNWLKNKKSFEQNSMIFKIQEPESLQNTLNNNMYSENNNDCDQEFKNRYYDLTDGAALHEIIYDSSDKPLDYIITDVNLSFEKILGINRDNVIGKPASAAYNVEMPPYLDIYVKVAETGFPSFFETYYPPLDQHFSITVFSPSKGKFITVFNDISGKVEADRILRESEEKFRHVFQNSPDSISISRIDNGIFINVNDGFTKLTGWNRDEVIGKNSLDINLWPEPEMREYVRNKFLEGNGYRNEYVTFRKKDGGLLNCLVSAAMINIAGESYVLTNAKDITEIYESQKRLDIMKKAIESSINSICFTNLDGIIIYINKSFLELWGYGNGGEVIGKHLSGFLRSDEYNSINLWLKLNEWAFGEVHALKKDGSVFHAFYSLNIVRDLENKPVQIMASFIDITEKKLIEQQLERLNLDLEEKVTERTDELNIALRKIENSNKELNKLNEAIGRESQKLLELNDKLANSEFLLKTANETKDKFFSIIAHDLKNPIQALLLTSDILIKYAAAYSREKLVEKCSQIHQTSLHISELLEKLLTWSRAQSGRIEFQPDMVNVTEILQKCTGIFANSLSVKEIKFKFPYTQEFLIYADEKLIETVLRNLVSNAIKYTKKDGEIEVSYRTENNFAIISVRDTGVGIHNDDIDKIMKIDKTFSTKGTFNENGTGLGLIICKEFIDLHGGQIWLESEPGKGSVFSFTIPYKVIN